MLKALAALVAVQLMCSCAPGEAGAISLHSKVRGHSGTSKANLQRCGDFVCEGTESSSNCPKDCFADAYSANLDGTAEYFTCTGWTSGTWRKLSISTWYRPTAAPTASDGIVVKNSTPREFIFNHGAADASKVRFSPTTSSTNWCETDTGRLQNGVWSHVVVSYDGTQTTNAAACKIYIDGVDRTTTYNGTVYSVTVTAGAAPILIGGITSISAFSPALIDDTAIWYGTAITSDQVTAIYNSGDPANLYPFNPTYYWKMGDDPLDEFDSTSGSKLLVDGADSMNCTPVATEGADKSATVP